MAVAEMTRAQIVADAQNGRSRLAYGNPVLCMDWVSEMTERYAGQLGDLKDGLTMYQENPRGGMKNPVADTSAVIARLERYMGKLDY